MVPASALVFAPLSWTLGIVVGVALYVGCIALYAVAGVPVEVTAESFRAGRATIERRFISGATAFTGPDATAERGPRLDARAFLLLRGGVDGLVRVELSDPADPTPYWLVSTRNPDLLVSKLIGAVASRE